MSDWRDQVAIEYGDNPHEIFLILYGQRYLLQGIVPVYDPLYDSAYTPVPRDDRYAIINPRVKVELQLYRVPPSPPAPAKRSWAKSMGLRRPNSKD